MVTKITKEGKDFYQCNACRLIYLDEETAQKCENWCLENKSCNLDIIKDAVELD